LRVAQALEVGGSEPSCQRLVDGVEPSVGRSGIPGRAGSKVAAAQSMAARAAGVVRRMAIPAETAKIATASKVDRNEVLPDIRSTLCFESALPLASLG